MGNNFDNEYDVKYLNKNFYSYLFSVLLIKKLGYKIELYCDKEAYEIYSLIPYDKIHIIDFDSDGISSKFWIWGKIKTQMLLKTPYIHIDGDVFLFRDIIGNRLSNGQYKVVVQSTEDKKILGDHFNEIYTNALKPFEELDLNVFWRKYDLTAYNCGVVGFNDLELKNKYVNLVKELLLKISSNGNFNHNRKKYYGMFLIAEQSLLYYLLKENNVNPLEILPYQEIIKRKNDWYSIANEIGYCHMWAYSKYKKSVIDKIKYKINKFFPQYVGIIKEFELKYSKLL